MTTQPTERQSLAVASLREIFEAKLREHGVVRAADVMPKITLRPLNGEPNWTAEIGYVPLGVLSVFNDVLAELRAAYNEDRPLRPA